MKICPNCQTRYTDDSLRFCLQDGTPLVTELEEIATPHTKSNEYETVVKPSSTNRIPVENQKQTGYTTNKSLVESEEKSSIFKVVALTVLTMFLLLSGIGAGAWIYFNNQKETAKNTNTVKNTKTVTKETPETNKNDNSETPTPAPTPEETPEINIEKVKKEIKDTLNGWKNAAEALNENDYMSFYAERLDYYNKNDVSIDFVRKDKVKAFTPFDDVAINISNLSVTTDSGETATAVFDKEWVFEGEDKYSEGKVQSQFKFKRVGEKWKIVSEKDLKVYYVNKE